MKISSTGVALTNPKFDSNTVFGTYKLIKCDDSLYCIYHEMFLKKSPAGTSAIHRFLHHDTDFGWVVSSDDRG